MKSRSPQHNLINADAITILVSPTGLDLHAGFLGRVQEHLEFLEPSPPHPPIHGDYDENRPNKTGFQRHCSSFQRSPNSLPAAGFNPHLTLLIFDELLHRLVGVFATSGKNGLPLSWPRRSFPLSCADEIIVAGYAKWRQSR